MWIELLFIGTLTVTSYRPIPAQTDSSPMFTSTGERVRDGGIAVSQDLLCKRCRKIHRRCSSTAENKYLHYGDSIYIEKYRRFFVVNDTMHERHKRHVDILVFTKPEEKRVGQFKDNVYLRTYVENDDVNSNTEVALKWQ